MTDVYYKVFRVPMWAVIGGSEETVDGVCKWLDKAEARQQVWPTEGFYNKIFEYKDKYPDYFNPDGTFNPNSAISFDFIARVASEHLKDFMGLQSGLPVARKAHFFDRKFKNEQDAVVWIDAAIELFDNLQLSQLFQVIKHSHKEDKARYSLWYTKAPCGIEVIKRISDKVITIGEDPRCDIDVSGLKGKKLGTKLEESFSQLTIQMKGKK